VKRRKLAGPDAPRKRGKNISFKLRMQIACLADKGQTPSDIAKELGVNWHTAVRTLYQKNFFCNEVLIVG